MGLNEFFNGKNPIKVGSPFAPMGEFPLAKAHDVIVDYDETTKTETRLDEKLASIGNGAPGVGILSIQKTDTNGLVDTYTITLTNGQKYEFTVTNGASGGGFVDVDNLPDDNISDQVIYRVTEKEFVNIHIKDEDFSGTFRECLENIGVINCRVYARFVSSLPTALIKSDISDGGVANIYVIKSTGIGYLNLGYGVITVGEYWFHSDTFNQGWTNNIEGENAAGVYSVYDELKPKYYIYKDGVWVELADVEFVEKNRTIIDVQFELPNENINENSIYRLETTPAYVYLAFDSGELRDARAYLGDESFLQLSPRAVDTLPNALKKGYVYIIKSTGIAYVDVGDGVKTLGEQATGSTGYDKGFLTETTEAGYFYSKTDPTLYTYHACKDGEWKKFVTDIEENKVVQTVPTPEEMDEIIDNATPEDEGNTYIYVGVTNEKYRYGGFYRITREIKVDE